MASTSHYVAISHCRLASIRGKVIEDDDPRNELIHD